MLQICRVPIYRARCAIARNAKFCHSPLQRCECRQQIEEDMYATSRILWVGVTRLGTLLWVLWTSPASLSSESGNGTVSQSKRYDSVDHPCLQARGKAQ